MAVLEFKEGSGPTWLDAPTADGTPTATILAVYRSPLADRRRSCPDT